MRELDEAMLKLERAVARLGSLTACQQSALASPRHECKVQPRLSAYSWFS